MVSETTIGIMLDDVSHQLIAAEVPVELVTYAVLHARDEMGGLGHYIDQPIPPEEYESTATMVLVWIHSSFAHKRAGAVLEHDEHTQNACDTAASTASKWRMVFA